MQDDKFKDSEPRWPYAFHFVEVLRKDSAGKELLTKYHIEQRDISVIPYGYELISKSIDKRRSRYGFTWEDLSSDEDRKYWIAGSLLKVVDLDTNEIVAERIGYMIVLDITFDIIGIFYIS